MFWYYVGKLDCLVISVADLHHFDTDPDSDPSFQFYPDPDPTTHFPPDLDPPLLQNDHLRLPPFHFDADPDPAFPFDADLDQTSQIYGVPDPNTACDSVRLTTLGFRFARHKTMLSTDSR